MARMKAEDRGYWQGVAYSVAWVFNYGEYDVARHLWKETGGTLDELKRAKVEPCDYGVVKALEAQR